MKPVDRTAAFADNRVLFGQHPLPGILAVIPDGDHGVRIYRRDGDRVSSEEDSFEPFLWIADRDPLRDFDRPVAWTSLSGDGCYRFIARFGSWRDYQAARKHLSGETYFATNDPVQQYLMASGRALFHELTLDDLHRLRLQLTLKPSGSIAAVQLEDSHGPAGELTGAEKVILEQLIETVTDRDPDVIEGHDLFRNLLPTLVARAKHHRLPLTLGRDGSAVTSRASRVQIAERTIQYPRFQVSGRHCVDTFLLTQFYDVATRELEGFELDDLASHFGLEQLAPVQVVGRVSDLLSPSYFIQAQIFPYPYQDVIVRGNATKIDALFLREYLHREHAIPALDQPRFFAGGYTDMFRTGLVKNVWHADVQSLYPSLILAFDIKPQSDHLELFVSLLRDLRAFRLSAKTAARKARNPGRQRHFEALQQTFKILINSFYGYLGFAQGHFSDFDAAEEVTRRGRELLKTMLDWLTAHGAEVIEIDTDGLYFVPPDKATPEQLEQDLQQALPAGVDVEIDGRFPAMFSYKMKNYALLDQAGQLHIKGSALRSRGLEKFQRLFLQQMLIKVLQDRAREIPALYEDYCARIEDRAWPLTMLAKTDTLQESIEVYQQKIARSARNRSAPYELAIQSGQASQPGDRISYYITGDKKNVSAYDHARRLEDHNPDQRDENIPYYLEKLRSLYKKFAPIIAPQIEAEIKSQTAKRRQRKQADQPGDLFGSA